MDPSKVHRAFIGGRTHHCIGSMIVTQPHQPGFYYEQPQTPMKLLLKIRARIRSFFQGFIQRSAPMARNAAFSTVERPYLVTERPANALLLPHERIRTAPLVRVAPKVGRNETCPCESGAKFKHCCGA